MKANSYQKFLTEIIFWGRITLLVGLVFTFIPVLYLAIVHNTMPPVPIILKSLGLIAAVVVVSWIVEPIAYFPILGITGTYMAWLSGNISNMKVPVSAIAQATANVKEGTPEGDIISTLSIGVSTLVNLIVLSLAVFFGMQVLNAVPATIKTSFSYILPAIFGAILANFSLRAPKLGLFAFTIAFLFTYYKLPMWIVLPVCVFGTICLGLLQFKRQQNIQKNNNC